MITDEQLAEWDALAKAAPRGPLVWVRGYSMPDGRHWCLVRPGQGEGEPTASWRLVLLATEQIDINRTCSLGQTPDLAFVAAAFTAVPALLAELRRLREVHARLVRLIGDMLKEEPMRHYTDCPAQRGDPCTCGADRQNALLARLAE